MSLLGTRTKRPDDVLDYDIDAGQKWLPDGDAIVNAVATISGGTAVITETLVSDGVVRVWIAGGAEGEINTVTVDITSAAGRVKEVSFQLRIALR